MPLVRLGETLLQISPMIVHNTQVKFLFSVAFIRRFVIIPTYKRTEGRAQVWGSEFTTKAASIQRDSTDFAAG
jgi:hypothetical protein